MWLVSTSCYSSKLCEGTMRVLDWKKLFKKIARWGGGWIELCALRTCASSILICLGETSLQAMVVSGYRKGRSERGGGKDGVFWGCERGGGRCLQTLIAACSTRSKNGLVCPQSNLASVVSHRLSGLLFSHLQLLICSFITRWISITIWWKL